MLFRWNDASVTHPNTAFKAEYVAGANLKSSQFNGRATTDAKGGAKLWRSDWIELALFYFNSSQR